MRNLVIGSGRNDILVGLQGDETIDGGRGNEYLFAVRKAMMRLKEKIEMNSISSGSEDDILVGGLGDDVLNGDDGNFTLQIDVLHGYIMIKITVISFVSDTANTT
jgi:Ca2+-binding RTX toxin-like protein